MILHIERAAARRPATTAAADGAARHKEQLFAGMLGSSPAMQTLFGQIERAGQSDATVLIHGESGTGKELVARALHDNSARRDKPFIALNCSALPAELVESELFGHVRGAFTGAHSDHAGLFQAAHGGTLFLDEIGDLALMTQAKLLRVMENGEILRVGSTQLSRVDVRVIAATHRPLDRMAEEAEFRQDLLFRLKVVKLTVPPLRERRSDIAELVQYFLTEGADASHGPRQLAPGVLEVLEQYDWPGNVRELRNMIAGAVIMTENDDALRLDDLPAELRAHVIPAERAAAGGPIPIGDAMLSLPFMEARARAVAAFDRAFLTAALERHNGNIARTARALGLHRQSLQKLMARRDIKAGRPSAP